MHITINGQVVHLTLMPSEGDENEENFIRACGFDYRVDVGSSIADPNCAGHEDHANLSQCQSEPQPVKTVEDCACESQVLPEALAIVNGVRITARDIEKATGDSVRQLQRQVVEARKRELDLLINSRLLSVEAKKRGISTTKLLEQEVVAKVKAPTDTEVQTFYDQNKARIQDDFKDVREDILRYLLDQRQRLEAKRFADVLRGSQRNQSPGYRSNATTQSS